MNIDLNEIDRIKNTVNTINNQNKTGKIKYITIIIIIIVGAIIIAYVKDKKSENWPVVEAKITDTETRNEEDRNYCSVHLSFTYNNKENNVIVEANNNFCSTPEYEGKYIKVRVNPKEDVFGNHSVHVHDWTTYEK